MYQKSKMKILQINISLILILVVCMMFFTACGSKSNVNNTNSKSNSTNSLIGMWVSPDADNQVMEIQAEKITFNYRKFDYSAEGNVLHLYQTYPNAGGVEGDMPFELDGDTLTIQLGSDFEGYFYGRSGLVKLVRK